MMATYYGRTGIVQVLINAGGNPRIADGPPGSMKFVHWNAKDLAKRCWPQEKGLIKLLKDAGEKFK